MRGLIHRRARPTQAAPTKAEVLTCCQRQRAAKLISLARDRSRAARYFFALRAARARPDRGRVRAPMEGGASALGVYRLHYRQPRPGLARTGPGGAVERGEG